MKLTQLAATVARAACTKAKNHDVVDVAHIMRCLGATLRNMTTEEVVDTLQNLVREPRKTKKK